MKDNATRAFATLLLTSVATGVGAEYRCSPAPSPIDQRACEAAKQGPDALRNFVQRMRVSQIEEVGRLVHRNLSLHQITAA